MRVKRWLKDWRRRNPYPRVDYCNAVYAEAPKTVTDKLQRVLPSVWSVTHGSFIVAWRHSSTMTFIGWMCHRGLLTRWVSWCTAAFMVRHLGTSPTITPHPPTSLLGFVCVLQTVTSSLYLAVVSTHMAVGRFRSPVRRFGTRCLTSWKIRRVVLRVLSSFLRQSCLVAH